VPLERKVNEPARISDPRLFLHAANPLGAFTGLAAWVLAAASLLTLTGAGPGWLRRTGALTLALLPVAFVVNAVVWWMSLPPGALR